MSQDNNPTDKKSLIAKSTAAQGYVSTQNSLYGLVNELVATVKGMRKEQKKQQEKIDELTKQLNDQKEELERLKLYQKDPSSSSSGEAAPTTTKQSASSDLAHLRRELVGMIGTSLAHHEEEYHDENPESKKEEPFDPRKSTTGAHQLQQEWEEFLSTIFPRHLTRTFHSNGSTILQSLCGYIDYPVALTPPTDQQKDLRIYSWSLQAEGPHWAVGMATVSSANKLNNTDDTKKLGDSKGEWAYRSDATLWSHNKQRHTFPSSDDKPHQITITLTLEFHLNKHILLKGSIDRQQPSAVWFDIPWKNFKKPTSFVPAVTCQKDSVVRFKGWER